MLLNIVISKTSGCGHNYQARKEIVVEVLITCNCREQYFYLLVAH